MSKSNASNGGDKNEFSLEYCLHIADMVEGGIHDPSYPSKCLAVLERARRSKILFRRNSSRKGDVWQPETGHGKRQVWGDPLVPNKHDNVSDKNSSSTTQDMYMAGKPEAVQKKIKLLRARSKARGGNIGDASVDEADVHRERQTHLQKRASNRVHRWGNN